MDENEEPKPDVRKKRIMNWTLGIALVAVILYLAVWAVQLIGTRLG